MSERFPDEVLQRALKARHDVRLAAMDRFAADNERDWINEGGITVEQRQSAEAEGLAAMRGVLEGHLLDEQL